jgi:hypothetical protein
MNTTMLFIVITMYFVLSCLFQLKHFVADYLQQNEYMLGKFKLTDWVKPLAAHCGVHAVWTFSILTALCPWISFKVIIFLTVMDFVIHFGMDRIKASPNMLGKFQSLSKGDFEEQQRYEDVLQTQLKRSHNPTELECAELDLKWSKEAWTDRKKSNKFFWIALGVDQLVHHLTHELIVYIAVLMFII